MRKTEKIKKTTENTQMQWRVSKVYIRFNKARKSLDETISRAKKQRMFEIIPSYKTIYNYIEKGILNIKNIDLPLKVKRKKSNKIGRKNSKIYRTSISQRPQYIK